MGEEMGKVVQFYKPKPGYDCPCAYGEHCECCEVSPRLSFVMMLAWLGTPIAMLIGLFYLVLWLLGS